jgi:uncharacterized protein YndB with AHSA1/START domain
VKIRISIDIDATPEKIFYWLGDPERAMTWMTSVGKTETLHKTDNWIGTTFREVVQDESGSTEMHGVVTEYATNRSMGFHLEGQYNDADVRFRLETRDGKTRVIQEADVRFKSITRLLMLILGPFFKAKIKKQSLEEFRKLKALCEQP